MKIHLHWNYRKPSDLEQARVAVTLCGSSYARREVTSDPRKVTCGECRIRHEARETEANEERPMTKSVQEMTGPELAAVYNEMRARVGKPPIKKFSTLAAGRRILQKALEDAPAPARPEAAKPVKPVETKITKADRKDDDLEIVVVDVNYAASNRKTDTISRFRKMVELNVKTVGEYLKKVTGGKRSDIKWWTEGKRIQLKS